MSAENTALPEGWKWATVDSISAKRPNSIVDGPFGSNLKVSDYVESGVPVLQGNNITGDSFHLDNLRFVSKRKASELARSQVRPGDLLVVKIGSIGYAAVIDSLGQYESAVIPANLLKASFDPNEVSGRYVHKWLTSPEGKRSLLDTASQTAQPALTLRRFRAIQIPLPPTPEQDAIIHILETVNEKIRRTEEVIEKLKRIKAGLLHDLLTRGLDENGELRDPIRHPEQFKESPLGLIPKNWSCKPLGEALKQKPRNGFSPKEVASFEGMYVLGLSCITSDGFKPIQLKPIGRKAYSQAFALCDGDLLLSRSNTRELVALPGIYREIGYPCIYPDLMMRLLPKEDLIPEFLELLLRSSTSRNLLLRFAGGTSGSMVKINGRSVCLTPVGYPSESEQQCIPSSCSADHK